MKRQHKILLFLIALGLLTLLWSGICLAAEQERPEYLKSATYVSDTWAINFWNSECENADEELRQIAEDGFNSIILLVPWREFQPYTDPISYNSDAFAKLDRIMEAADRQGLWVILRVGYTWDYYSTDNVLLRYQRLIYQDSMKKAWRDYAETVYKKASAHSNFYGGFLTWEDFWNYIETAGNLGKGIASRDTAAYIGYQDYVKEHYSLDEVKRLYNNEISSYSQIYLPGKDQSAMYLFYRFYDDFLSRLLKDTQQVFPGISMEVRLDVDPVPGVEQGADHYSTFPCGDAAYTALMYSVSMGQHNRSETISAASALEKAEAILGDTAARTGGKPLFIDQFLYMDTTLEFSHNAQIAMEERPQFIRDMAPILRGTTMGYGVWTYRNYVDNHIYNPQFGLGKDGWRFTGDAEVVRRGSGNQAYLPGSGSRLAQEIRNPGGKRQDRAVRVRFTADSDEPCRLTVRLDDAEKTVTIDGGKQYDLDFGKTGYSQLSFSVDKEVFIDNISVSTYEQDGQLYGLDGEELSCLQAIRDLNSSLN